MLPPDLGDRIFNFPDPIVEDIRKIAPVTHPSKVRETENRIGLKLGGGRGQVLDPKAGNQPRLPRTLCTLEIQEITLVADAQVVQQAPAECMRPPTHHV